MGFCKLRITMVVLILGSLLSGCAVVAVADAAVSVAATVVETTVDVAVAGVKAVTPGGNSKK